jgi:hypothetical protein
MSITSFSIGSHTISAVHSGDSIFEETADPLGGTDWKT